ncbi:MAG: sugar phosphate isomerase/epimerase [Acidimicrobiia bacterium]|nr:sugar phosphate isomerase/epimerase [Acidimicrobiia bacterium]
MTYQFRHAICNEVYEGWNFEEACKSIKKAGYQGIEIAHFTLKDDPAAITPDERRQYRTVMENEGLEFVGLHWLMVAPKGLHVTTSDVALRERSWRHIDHLIDLCADLSGDRPGGSVMIFGSPQQRATLPGVSREDAMRRYQDGLASVAAHAAQRGVTILAEALPSNQCDVMNTLAEAAAIVKEINSPSIQTMFDTHNALDETDPHHDVVDRYFDLIRHVHVNEMDGRHPGAGDYDFKPIFETLRRRNYKGWVSLEAFDFTPGAETIANESLRHLEAQIQKLAA